jgi:protein ImuB
LLLPNMLWIAIHLPEIALQRFLRGSVSPEALAVSEGRVVVAANEAAQKLGVRSGMGIATACAVAPDLVLKPRNAEQEAMALREIAVWAGQFTAQINLDPPTGVLLEVGASLRLFGGIAALKRRIDDGLAGIGYAAVTACAPTPLAARMLAKAGRNSVVDIDGLTAAIAPLPVQLLDVSRDVAETLTAIGARRIGDCLALPRDGLARRCGPELLRQLDRALGRLPDPRRWFEAPATFSSRIELGWPAESTEPILFVGKRLLAGLAGFLRGRQAGIECFVLTLEHEHRPSTVLVVELASRSRDEARFVNVLRERLAHLTQNGLDAPVIAVTLSAEQIHNAVVANRSLFDDARDSREPCARLLENLRARLGDAAVTGVRAIPAHRPEFAWETAEPGAKQRAETLCGNRPLWLLEPPQALPERNALPQWDGPVALLSGPERIESGWWDGQDCSRDYYLASGPQHELLWLFRERRSPQGWYLHGLFA